ncbi:site-specific integrase [Pedobacter puniceum]|uniref:Tyrosine-type recombinase/integrase n=1 Tax=Pedobacter puniceum TaxID=2666136 RepID=A0A7K0FLV0_9SPHI|nr:site-specific integrase [Pedobacter puniceum]MRX46631.1 tyrosine-type recombinase/integrase [Pedobacter puniceum]
MASIKIMLDKRRPKKNQEFNIIFRITHDRVPHIVPTGLSTHPNDWNEGLSCFKASTRSSTNLNNILSTKLHKIQEAISELEARNEFSISAIRETLIVKEEKPKTDKVYCFNEFSKSLIETLIRSNKTGNSQVYNVAKNRLMSYAGKDTLLFKEIDYQFLEGFKDKLASENIKPNTISNYLRTIRAIFNKAIKAKVVDRSLYPFYDIQIKGEKTQKRSITKEDILKLNKEKVKVGSQEWHAKNYFFLSFALIGASFTDIAYLTKDNIQKDRIVFRRRKTKKLYDIKLTPLAKSILKLYTPDKYLLPIFPSNMIEDGIESKNITRQAIKQTNKYLDRIAKRCKIELNITTYVARHSWATISKRMGYSNELIAEALGHEYGNKITNIYLDSFDQHLIDDLNLKVQKGLK